MPSMTVPWMGVTVGVGGAILYSGYNKAKATYEEYSTLDATLDFLVPLLAVSMVGMGLFSLVVLFLAWYRKAIGMRRTKKGNLPAASVADVNLWAHSDDLATQLELEEDEEEGKSETREGSNGAMAEPENIASDEDLLRHRMDTVEDFWSNARNVKKQGEIKVPEADYFLASSKFINCFATSKEEFEAFYANIEWVMLQRGDKVFQEGEDADSMYIVADGRVGIFRRPDHDASTSVTTALPTGDGSIKLSEFHQGENFGALDMLFSKPRNTTCVALTPTALIRASKQFFLSTPPHVQISFIQTTIARQWRIAQFTLHNFFRFPEPNISVSYLEEADPLLTQFSSDQAKVTQTFGAGETIISKGSHLDRMYVLLAGKVGFQTGDSNVVQNETKTGAVFGGVSTLAGIACDLSVIALTTVKVGWIERKQLEAKTASKALLGLCKNLLSGFAPSLSDFQSLGFKRAWHRSGDKLYKRGDKAKYIYIVVSGRVAMTKGSTKKGYSHNSRRESIGGVSPQTSPVKGGGKTSLLEEELEEVADKDQYHFPSYEERINNISYEVGRGECFGEASFFSRDLDDNSGDMHGHTAVCVRDSEIVYISENAFKLLTEQRPAVYKVFAGILATRLKRNQRNVDKSFSRFQMPNVQCVSVALVAAGPEVDLPHFSEMLRCALLAHGGAKSITPSVYDRVFGEGSSQGLDSHFHRSRMTFWLTEQEETHRFLIFEAGAEATAWSQMSVRAADCVFVVGNANGSPAVSKSEQQLLWPNIYGSKQQKLHRATQFTHKELVLVHADHVKLPRGTKEWFKGRKFEAHHHVKTGSVRHFERVARHLAGKTVGVCLSGGGSRGLAHFGVVRCMYEQRIPVDSVGGCSQGSFMSALLALRPVETKKDLQSYRKKVAGMAAGLGSIKNLLLDSTFPIMAYFSGERFNKMIKLCLTVDGRDDVQIEDLWIPYFCVTTNVSKSDQSTHRHGSLWKYVRSSMSILSFLPPMVCDNSILIDGGYCNNLPADCLRTRYKIGCDVENKDEEHLKNPTPYGDHLSGWWLACAKIWASLPGTAPIRVPKYMDIVHSLLYVNHNRIVRTAIKSGLMDLYIRPPVDDIQLLDYHLFEQIANIGYASAKIKFTRWRIENAINKHLPMTRVTDSTEFKAKYARSVHKSSPLMQRRGSFASAPRATTPTIQRSKHAFDDTGTSHSTLRARKQTSQSRPATPTSK